jgi:hypothetical protein
MAEKERVGDFGHIAVKPKPVPSNVARICQMKTPVPNAPIGGKHRAFSARVIATSPRDYEVRETVLTRAFRAQR